MIRIRNHLSDDELYVLRRCFRAALMFSKDDFALRIGTMMQFSRIVFEKIGMPGRGNDGKTVGFWRVKDFIEREAEYGCKLSG